MGDDERGEALERAPFAYAVIRVVPRVEREEFVNVGVVLFSRPRRYLGLRAHIDADRLRALWPEIDLDAIARQLDVLRLVAVGDPVSGRQALSREYLKSPAVTSRPSWNLTPERR